MHCATARVLAVFRRSHPFAARCVAHGGKALTAYLGPNRETWAVYDSCALIEAAARHPPLLVDQSTADEFLSEQLRTPLLESACAAAEGQSSIRTQEGYDHSYFFIASFIDEHIAFHAGQWSCSATPFATGNCLYSTGCTVAS